MRLKDVAIKNRKELSPIWLFPFIFYFERTISSHVLDSNLLFWLLSIPFFYWAVSKEAELLQNGLASKAQLFLLGGVIPVFIFGLLVYLGKGYGL